ASQGFLSGNARSNLTTSMDASKRRPTPAPTATSFHAPSSPLPGFCGFSFRSQILPASKNAAPFNCPPKNLEISIFERKDHLGAGMPYSSDGANKEHITNVSDNEIPVIFNSIEEWVKIAPTEILEKFNINAKNFNEYKVLPRLFFGEYLSAQFSLLQQQAGKNAITTKLHLSTKVADLRDNADKNSVSVITDTPEEFEFDLVVICTGHNWPIKHEGTVPGYFDYITEFLKKQMAEFAIG
ncbi:MAG: hypothetical protein EOO01_45055, partial [Chitinophagaceae bacterium]